MSKLLPNENEKQKEIIESEETYSSLINNLMDIILEGDSSGKVSYVSPQCFEIIGYKPSEIIGKNAFNFIHPEDILIIAEAMKKSLKTREIIHVPEYRLVHKNGNAIPVSARGKFVKINGNDKFIVNIRDISREKEIELKLKETEKHYELIVKNINDIIWTMDLNLKTNYVSPSIKRILGYTVEEDLARPIHKKFTPESLNRIGKLIKRYFTSKNARDKDFNPVLTFEVDQYHKNGSIIPCEVTVNPMRDSDGIAFGLVGITRVIAKRKEAEKKLKESEEKYRDFVENAHEGIWALDENENTIFVNPRLCEMLGYTKDELLGKSLRLFIPNSMKTIINGNRSKRAKGIKEMYELQLYKKDGAIIYTEVKAAPILDDSHNYRGSFAYITDITSKKVAEQQLKESEEKYRNLFENSPHAISLINSKGIIIQCNSNVEKIFGYKLGDLIGQHFRKFPLFSKENCNVMLNSFNKLINGDIPEPQELILTRKDGNKIWVSVQASIVHLKNETLFQVITQDISKIKEAEMRLEEQNKELEQLNELKTEFLSRASHELKAPLVAIKGNADLVLTQYTDKLKPDMTNKLEEIQMGCKRLQEIIHKLIESSKLESSKIELHTAKDDLANLIRKCVNEVQTLAKMKSIKINIDIEEVLVADINKDQIQEVISNLLINAINYSPRDGIININSERKANAIIISIKDKGIGFTEDEKEIIFQKFGKIKRTVQGYESFSEGSGLGLYIAKKIINLHGGDIWLESEGRNKGSTFYFTVPIKGNQELV